MGNMQTLENDNVLVELWRGAVHLGVHARRRDRLRRRAPRLQPDVSHAPCGSGSGGRWTPRAPRPQTRDGKTTVYASWNGATELRSWRVLAEGSTTPVAEADRKGFETAIEVREGLTRFQVQALDANGQVIGTSKTITTKGTP